MSIYFAGSRDIAQPGHDLGSCLRLLRARTIAVYHCIWLFTVIFVCLFFIKQGFHIVHTASDFPVTKDDHELLIFPVLPPKC